MCVCVCMTSPKRQKSSHRAQIFLYRLFQLTKLFDFPDDAMATDAAYFGKGLPAGGGVVFNVKWRK